MTKLTNVEIEAIRKRAESATEGPWNTKHGTRIVGVADADSVNDAEFIAHARTDIPKLLAEIERLQNELSETREYNRHYFDLCKERKREIERLRNVMKTAEKDIWWGNAENACERVSEMLKEAIANEAIQNNV